MMTENFSGHDQRSKQLVSDVALMRDQLREIEVNNATLVDKEDLGRLHDRVDNLHKDVCQLLGRTEKK